MAKAKNKKLKTQKHNLRNLKTNYFMYLTQLNQLTNTVTTNQTQIVSQKKIKIKSLLRDKAARR